MGQRAFRVLESRQPEGPSLRHLLPVVSKVTRLAPHSLHEGSHPSGEATVGTEGEACPEGPAPCPELVF